MSPRRDLPGALRTGPVLAATGVLASLVAVWAAAAPRPAQDFGRPDPERSVVVRGYNDPPLAPQSEIDAGRYVGPRDPSSLLERLLGWTALVLVSLALLVLVALAVRALLRVLRDRRLPPDDARGPDLERVAAAVGTDADERLTALSGGTPAEGIVAAWTRLEETLRGAGVALPVSRTSSETTVATLGRFVLDAGALHELAGLYREALWSRHPMTEEHRGRAEAALRSLDAQLAATAGSGRG
ncbi:DUF4129 domain-containing protein [Phycicoccus flavus]|uniref:DUF4129 domain-containing protein n=1 Tax=Phycicoccus flavus TaxID=2502783 RepID=A0A8T6R0C2_9MICO|nr:DUF4129 domain-containing protein [Phycicoccus flavus]NHA67286.1 DUF4129 domain-containing protein [Phycicoccus flavus]